MNSTQFSTAHNLEQNSTSQGISIMGTQASMANVGGYYPQNRSISLNQRNDLVESMDIAQQQSEVSTPGQVHMGISAVDEHSNSLELAQTPDIVSAEHQDGDMMLVVDEDEILRQNMAARQPQFVLQEFTRLELDRFSPPNVEECEYSATPSIIDGYTEPVTRPQGAVDFSRFQQIQADKNVGKPEIIGVTGFRFRRRSVPKDPPDDEARRRIERFRQSVRQRYVI